LRCWHCVHENPYIQHNPATTISIEDISFEIAANFGGKGVLLVILDAKLSEKSRAIIDRFVKDNEKLSVLIVEDIGGIMDADKNRDGEITIRKILDNREKECYYKGVISESFRIR